MSEVRTHNKYLFGLVPITRVGDITDIRLPGIPIYQRAGCARCVLGFVFSWGAP